MARRDELNRIADDFVQDRHSNLASLRAKAERLREQLVSIETQIVSAATTSEYRRRYQPEVNGIPICPYCFLNTGQTVPLNPQSSAMDWDEWLCRECQSSFTLGPS
jgi:hypothetical protein